MAMNSLAGLAVTPQHPRYEALTARPSPLYQREGDVRSPFQRDYNRILHSLAYRRLKRKTQVFFNVANDHICTRIEHVQHVESVSHAIASYLGLNTELTCAIATGHDLGHAPFGHQGESVLKKLTKEHGLPPFWHEKNGVRFVDKIELLEDNRRQYRNMNLTYAVRDGIISHCGEVDENALRPREDLCDLDEIVRPGQVQPATWEGCVVKLSDKIGYLGRDIADAISLGFLGEEELQILDRIGREHGEETVNTTVLMHNLISDVCRHSDPEHGICLSDRYLSLMNEIKKFNYQYIYLNEKQGPFRRYSELILTELFNALLSYYAGGDTLARLERDRRYYPELCGEFVEFVAKYVTPDLSAFPWGEEIMRCYANLKVYGDLSEKTEYIQAIVDFLSGMTDSFAITLFNDLISY